MTYVEGFIVAVPTANKEAYRKHAADALPMFKEFGATRMVEGWGDDVPRGKVNDLYGAVDAKEDETVMFSWIEYPDRATRDAAVQKMMSDERMKDMGGDMPFDGKRMVFGGFEALIDEGESTVGGYVDGVILPVPHENKDGYRSFAEGSTRLFLEHGAQRVVEGWGDDVPKGEVTDHWRAVHAKEGENVVYSWIEWPSKQARNDAWEKLMKDERMSSGQGLFDGKRMIFGGFEPIVDA